MIANALPRPLTAGSVDNAILRADGTGETSLQNSGLIVDDAVVAYSATGDAATDVITATGHNFIANQGVMFPSLTGGSGLNTTTVYFVRDISGSTFKVSATSGGAAINFTTNITAGSVIAIQANVAVSQNTTETNSALVLTPKGTGALIAGARPNGTASTGNARGAGAVDLQLSRSAATQVASGANSVICGGINNTTSGPQSFIGSGQNNAITTSISDRCIIVGGSGNTITSGNANTSIIGCGQLNNISGYYSGILSGDGNSVVGGHTSFIGGGIGNQSNATVGAVVCGNRNSATGQYAAILGGNVGIADRYNMQVHSAGSFINDSVPRGDAQRARFVMRNKTTTNSAVELFLDGSSTRLTIPSGKIFAFTINIAGVSSTGGAVAHYMRQYCLKNVAATTSEVYAPITIGTDNAAGTSLSLTFNDPADALVVSVTGTASTIWRWVASVDAVEIGYGI